MHRHIIHSASLTFCLTGLLTANEAIDIIDTSSHELTPASKMSLDDISTQLENPLTSLWSITLENSYRSISGNSVNGSTEANVLNFQPGMPIPMANDFTFIARPVFPLVTSPVLDTNGDTIKHTTGIGDIQMLSLYGPDKSKGFVWGLGTTMKFPTASSEFIGAGKWQAGPAAMAFHFGDKWTLGALAEHWWSFAGDSDRAHTNETNIKYIVRHKLPDAWSIGAGPTIAINWKEKPNNRYTIPVGLGLSKTAKFGELPIKFRLEAHYNLVRPDNIGQEWQILFRIAPVIPSPFSQP
ncbi:hypothetical protein [Rubritalea tangerina]|uniref:Neuromedin U n=1 Tax=Rubritalea tangerina TaxID=430798 RepID=A0ABW4ZE32_9BACT